MSAADDHPSQPAITLHPPLMTAGSREQPPPSVDWLAGSWHVTHSTLPMWRSKRRVVITYTALPDSKLDDLVEYDDGKPKTVRGVDTPLAGAGGWAWDWRGKGWLAIASSRWEVLGYGDEEGTGEGEERRQWVVTYFAKTLFTPAGIDIYSRHPGGLRPGTVGAVKAALAGMPDEGVRKLSEELFEVKMD